MVIVVLSLADGAECVGACGVVELEVVAGGVDRTEDWVCLGRVIAVLAGMTTGYLLALRTLESFLDTCIHLVIVTTVNIS